MTPPIVREHDGVSVIRDDLFPVGTKARFMPVLFEGVTEAVYASPAEGGAQTALASVAKDLGKRATIFVAARAKLHPRTLEAARLGAKVVPVRPGYLSVVQARAKDYARSNSARLVPFGVDLPEAITRLSEAALATGLDPDEVWCAAGSGVLARALAKAWPRARRHVVQVGRALAREDVAGATIHIYPRPFSDVAKTISQFPSDPHYDAKAWEVLGLDPGMTARKRPGRVVFWNVAGPARP